MPEEALVDLGTIWLVYLKYSITVWKLVEVVSES
jgi:hypothetical protein